MPSTMLRVKSVEAKSAYRLAVSWSDGSRGIVDISQMIKRGGVFSELSDAAKFAAVRMGEKNRVVEWPKPSDELGYPLIDIDAESLHIMYAAQKDREVMSKIRAAVRSLAEKAYIIPEHHHRR